MSTETRRSARKELNSLRMFYIVKKFFPKILVPFFKSEWKRCTSYTWNDDPQSGKKFWDRESSENKRNNSQKRRRIRNGDSSEFHCTDLFYLILHSSSVGENLFPHHRAVVEELRKIRYEVVHRSNIEVPTREFDSFFAQVCGCFTSLGFSTEELNAVKTTVCFDEERESLRTSTSPESFANSLPHNSLTSLTTVSPRLMQKASCQYPCNYKTIMLDFNKYIYSMDWDAMDQRGEIFLQQYEDWSVKLFVKIELAYGYNVRGDSEKAIALLNEVTHNAFRAGPNSTRILSRAYSRMALHYIFVLNIEKAEFFATEALNLISTLDSPEEQILGLKSLADCILYGDGSVEERRKKLEPLYNQIIDLSREHRDDIPRCLSYMRFALQDKASLCLGFTRHGFIETTPAELEEGEKYLMLLDEEDFKDPEENTYINAFIFICKSIARFKRWKLAENEQQRKEMWKEGLEFREKAREISTALQTTARTANSGLMLMITLLDEYKQSCRLTYLAEERPVR